MSQESGYSEKKLEGKGVEKEIEFSGFRTLRIWNLHGMFFSVIVLILIVTLAVPLTTKFLENDVDREREKTGKVIIPLFSGQNSSHRKVSTFDETLTPYLTSLERESEDESEFYITKEEDYEEDPDPVPAEEKKAFSKSVRRSPPPPPSQTLSKKTLSKGEKRKWPFRKTFKQRRNRKPKTQSNGVQGRSFRGGTQIRRRRRRRRGGQVRVFRPLLVMYETYFTRDALPFLHKQRPYRGVRLGSNVLGTNRTKDIDVLRILPILKDEIYKGLLCEFGAMFAIDSKLWELQKKELWVGFQSWKAKEKRISLKPLAMVNLMRHFHEKKKEATLKKQYLNKEVFYYWSGRSVKDSFSDCKQSGKCSTVFSTVFIALYETNASISGGSSLMSRLPPLPEIERGYSDCSYWILHRKHFKKFMTFARMFFVTLERFWNLHDDVNNCPLDLGESHLSKMTDFGYTNSSSSSSSSCWCYIMERLLNIWVYHTGIKMIWVNSNTGQMEEQHPVSERVMWSRWFSDSNSKTVFTTFIRRATNSSLDLYSKLGGVV